MGYEDLNDHARLRLDPLLAVACDKRDPLEQGGRHLPRYAREFILDLDDMGHRLHGAQEGRHFNAYYDDYCYLPLCACVGDLTLWAQLRTCECTAADGGVPAFAYLLLEPVRALGLAGTIRLQLPKIAPQVTVSARQVYVQMNSAFPLQELFRLCQQRLTNAALWSGQRPPPQPAGVFPSAGSRVGKNAHKIGLLAPTA